MKYHFADQFRAEMEFSRKSRQQLWAENKERVLREQMQRAMAKSAQIEAQMKRRS
jgi:hypothetical protein